MSWDPFQRAVLAELGHVLYVPATVAQPGPSVQAAEADAVPAMLARLARAAGMQAEALRAHGEIVAAAGRLRGDAEAKRALWPHLRNLRRALR